MQVPLELNFRNMPSDPQVEAEIRNHVAKLEEVCDWIIGCHVVVEAPHHHQQKGGLYHVRIHITLPPRLEVVVDRESHQNHAHEDVHVAVRDAFKAARRQLKNHARKARGMIKHHEAPSHGKIVKLFDEPAYGFIEAPDQTEIYFDYNAVISGDAEQLEIGSEVRFVQEDGDKGPQATSVQLVGRHHSLETK